MSQKTEVLDICICLFDLEQWTKAQCDQRSAGGQGGSLLVLRLRVVPFDVGDLSGKVLLIVTSSAIDERAVLSGVLSNVDDEMLDAALLQSVPWGPVGQASHETVSRRKSNLTLAVECDDCVGTMFLSIQTTIDGANAQQILVYGVADDTLSFERKAAGNWRPQGVHLPAKSESAEEVRVAIVCLKADGETVGHERVSDQGLPGEEGLAAAMREE